MKCESTCTKFWAFENLARDLVGALRFHAEQYCFNVLVVSLNVHAPDMM